MYSFWYSQSQPKRRSAAIKIINPDTNTEIDLSSMQSTSSGMSSASSSTTRLSDHADTQGQSSDTENLVAKEFREKFLSSLKPAHNAIIKSPTETKAPVSTVDQSLDAPSLEHVDDEVDMSEPDRSAEQPTATLPPEVTQHNEGQSALYIAKQVTQLTAAISYRSLEPVRCNVLLELKHKHI